MNKDQIKGRVEEAKGKVKEVTGKILDDDDMELKRNVQKNAGKDRSLLGVKACLIKKLPRSSEPFYCLRSVLVNSRFQVELKLNEGTWDHCFKTHKSNLLN